MTSPPLSRQLIEVSRHLISVDGSTNAHIDRAVSTAYYAIFEHICCAASDLLIGKIHDDYLTRAKSHLRRSIGHTALAGRCKKAQSPKYCFPPKIVKFANRLYVMQEKRHLADYDIYKTFTSVEAEELIDEVENALDIFDSTQKKHQIAFLVWAIIDKPKHDK